jgi:predicted DNA-binding protein (MmcQ/YjbR family)
LKTVLQNVKINQTEHLFFKYSSGVKLMDFNGIKNCCLSMNGAYEDYPFGPETIVFKVESKMFALFSCNSNRLSISLKCDPFLAQSLREQYSTITPGYHLNKHHWNSILIDGSIPESEIRWMIEHSYQLVVKRLTREEKRKLGELQVKTNS